MHGGSAGSPWGGDYAGAQEDGRNGPPDQDRSASVKQIPEDRYGKAGHRRSLRSSGIISRSRQYSDSAAASDENPKEI
jgi:hypothetical protein